MFQSDFTAEEFRARRHKLCEAVGRDAVVLLQGARGPKGSHTCRQYNDFYYLCGVETPWAYLLIQATDERTTVFLPSESQLDRQCERELLCAENSEYVCAATGVDEAVGLERLGQRLAEERS